MGVVENVLKTKELKDLVIEKSDSNVSFPNYTEKRVNDAIKLLKEVEKNNGYFSISETVGLTAEQVKFVHTKMKEKIVELTEKN